MGLLFIAALVCTTRQVLVLIVVLSSTIMEKIGRIAHDVSRQFLLYFLCYATNYILPILVRVEQNCHVSPIQCMTVHQIKSLNKGGCFFATHSTLH